MKKTISILVVLAMLLTMVPAVFAVESEVIYSQKDLALAVSYNEYGEPIATAHVFAWEATGSGTVCVNITEVTPGVRFWFGDYLPVSVTEPGSYEFPVAAGEHLFKIIGYAKGSECAATVSFELTFTPGDDETVKEEYLVADELLETVGTHDVTLLENAYTTVYEFNPGKAATYQFSVPEGYLVGCWGYSSAFVWDVTGDAKTNTLEHTITSAGQPVMIGITGEGATTLTITEGEAYRETTYVNMVYKNKAIGNLSAVKPTDIYADDYYDLLNIYEAEAAALKAEYGFTVPEEATLGGYVDISVSHDAVLGDDGYYHLDSTEGDILLVDLDYIYQLTAVLHSERPVMVIYDRVDDYTINKYDIAAAAQSYEAVCDDNGYFPLTEDLIYFYKEYAIGAQAIQTIYLSGRNYVEDTAWMYACLTMSLPETEDYVLTIEEAIAMGSAMEHNTYTADKYYVTGVITEVYNTTYGNMKITDEAGNILTIYGTYDADGTNRYDAMEVKPVAGDTVTVYGPLGQYNGTPQIKNGWVVEHTPGETNPEEPEVPADPEADSVLTIEEALALGASKDHNTYTEGKYYVTGVITEVYNETYGNMRITDENGNILTVYGTYDADGTNRYDAMEVKPVAGDTVTVYGPLGQFNGTAQMKNAWIVEHVVTESTDPEADTVLTIEEVLALGASKDHNNYTAGKYYVTGVITEVYNETYGNMKITDENGNILTVYGTYSADGSARYDAMEVKPVAGDTVTVYGIIGQFNGTPQLKNGWIVEHIPAEDETLQGSGTFEDPYVINSLPCELSMIVPGNGGSGDMYYVYTAEKDGKIEIKDSDDDYNTGSLWLFINNWMDAADIDELFACESTILNEVPYCEVKAGDSILINHYQTNYMPDDWALDVVLQYVDETAGGEEGGESGGEEGGEEPGDDPVIPNSGDWTGTDVAVAADGMIEIIYTPESDGILEVAVDCDTGWWVDVIDVVDGFYGEAFWSDTSTSPVSINLLEGIAYSIKIYPYDEKAGGFETCNAVISYELTFTPNVEIVVVGELFEGANPIELPDPEPSVSYSYTATQTGTLYFFVDYVGLDMSNTGSYSDDTDDIVNDFSYSTALTVDGQALPYYYFGTIEVVAGETYIFTWTDMNEYFDWSWEATLNLSYTDENYPVIGSEDIPVELKFEDCPTNSIEIAAGSTAYYQLIGFTGSNFTITGSGAYAIVTTQVWNMETGEVKDVQTRYNAKNGVVTVPVTEHYFTLQIGNSGSAAATFALAAYYPEGSPENPAELKLGKNEVVLAEGNENGYVFEWVAEKDGVLTISVDGQYWLYNVTNYGSDMEDYEGDTYGEWHLWADDPVVASEEWTVKAGDIIVVQVCAYDPNEYAYVADTITVTATFEADGEEEPGDVLMGDVNGDTVINNIDAMLVLQYALKLIDETALDVDAADVNGDTVINNIDAMLILQFALKIIDKYPTV